MMTSSSRRFHLKWHKEDGEQKLYCWQAVPPDPKWVAVGMIFTTTADTPPLSALRCVPRRWVVPSTMQPTLLWNDAGSGGRPGSLWRMNEHGLLAANKGFPYAAPSGTAWRFKAMTWGLSAADDATPNPDGGLQATVR